MKVLVLTYWDYHDPLIQTYTLPYLRLIHERINPDVRFHLFTLQKSTADIENVDDFIEVHSRPYHSFGFRALINSITNFVQLWRLVKLQQIEMIHCWCTPAGVYGLTLKWLTGRKLLIDSFEPHAEPMLEAGVWKKYSLAFQVLFWFEKMQARHADYIIACVSQMKNYCREKYGYDRSDMLWKPACVDFNAFSLKKRKDPDLLRQLGWENKIVCVYAGKFGGSYLKEEVFEFVKLAIEYFGKKFRFLLLSSHSADEVRQMLAKHEISSDLVLQTYVDHQRVPYYLGLGDFGLVPFVPVPSKRYGSPIKTGEYMAMGLPIVITKDISDDSRLIKEYNIGVVLDKNNADEMRELIVKVEQLIHSNLSEYISQIAWDLKNIDDVENVYHRIYFNH